MNAILSFQNVFPEVKNARYNVAAWRNSDSGNLLLIGRDVVKAGRVNEADVGPLILSEFDAAGKLLQERTIWQPEEHGKFFLEDPRAIVEPDGQVVVGLTAVIGSTMDYKTYGAVVRLQKDWRDQLPPVTVVQTFGPSKNMTPLGKETFLLRPWNEEYSHKLLLFRFENSEARKIADVHFPTILPWAQIRIGTTMPPLWMDDGTRLFIMHGISIVNGKEVYSIGLAQLVARGEGFEVIVDPNPLITPDTFVGEDGQQIVEELRPTEKRVVYACGGVIDAEDHDCLRLFVNVGDRATFEVKLFLPELYRRLAEAKSLPMNQHESTL